MAAVYALWLWEGTGKGSQCPSLSPCAYCSSANPRTIVGSHHYQLSVNPGMPWHACTWDHSEGAG